MSAPRLRVLVDASLDIAALRVGIDGAGARVDTIGARLAGDDVAGVITWERAVGAADLARLPGLRVVVTPSVGFDHIDLDAARRHGGLWVCHVPGYCVEEMADTAVGLILALLRGIVVLDRHVRDGGWEAEAAGPLRRVRGSRLGVVGHGRIGAALAERARALGFEVWASDPAVPAEEIAAAGVRPVSLDELLADCHVVSLHAPLTPATRGLIGRRELARMRRGALLVNTARGALLDTDAVLDALDDGRLGGAALDVLEAEPPTAEHAAPQRRNLIVTPHAAYYSPDAEAELHRRAAHAVRAVLEGRPPEGALVIPGAPVAGTAP
jgi:D-3-phosphoglycerate dehydrogenase